MRSSSVAQWLSHSLDKVFGLAVSMQDLSSFVELQQPAAAERISFSDSDNLIVAVAADRSSMT